MTSESQTAAYEACAAAANCTDLTMNNTIFLLTADGTVATDNPDVCESVGTSCVPGPAYYVDECITNGYPFSSLGISAGNSVRPALAFALACVSAAIAAFA